MKFYCVRCRKHRNAEKGQEYCNSCGTRIYGKKEAVSVMTGGEGTT